MKPMAIFADLGDAASLCRGLVYLLERRADMQPLKRSARSFIATHHDNSKKAKAYADLYQELCIKKREWRAA